MKTTRSGERFSRIPFGKQIRKLPNHWYDSYYYNFIRYLILGSPINGFIPFVSARRLQNESISLFQQRSLHVAAIHKSERLL